MGPTYIVTGGAGFVGANLVAALMARAPRPRIAVIDNFRTGSYANITEACDRRGSGPFDGGAIPLSVHRVRWESVIARLAPAAVFHLGAITDTTLADESEMIRENVGGFRRLLGACHGAGAPVVYASSAAVYGSPPQERDRQPYPLEAAGSPRNVYGFSKWLMEAEHRRFAESNPGARVVGLRYFNVFGPGEARKGPMASMVHQLASKMLAGAAPRLFIDGTQARDQVHVDDVVDCTIAAAGLGERPDPAPGVYNLGSGIATTFNQIADALRAALPESARPTEYFPMPPAVQRWYQTYTCADMSATRRGLGWTPRRRPPDAIADYARWLRASAPTP